MFLDVDCGVQDGERLVMHHRARVCVCGWCDGVMCRQNDRWW